MPYVNRTERSKIEKQIGKELQEQDAAIGVLNLIDTLCGTTNPAGDRVNQWLGLFNENNVMASKRGGKAPVIEVYPSGTSGPGREDRLTFQVGQTEVAVTEAYRSRHN